MQQPKAYQEADDLLRVQQALMQWTQQMGDCNYLHKGDVRHRLFNGGYQLNPSDMLHIWSDDAGEIKGFVLLYPHWETFDLQVAPDMKYTDFHYEIVTIAPDGRFASFTQVWVDEVNKSISFEPIGTHSDFRRRGIGKAMMVNVLKRMQAEHCIQVPMLLMNCLIKILHQSPYVLPLVFVLSIIFMNTKRQ